MRMSIKIIRHNICAKIRIIALGYVSSCFIKEHTNDFLINELKKALRKNLNKPCFCIKRCGFFLVSIVRFSTEYGKQPVIFLTLFVTRLVFHGGLQT